MLVAVLRAGLGLPFILQGKASAKKRCFDSLSDVTTGCAVTPCCATASSCDTLLCHPSPWLQCHLVLPSTRLVVLRSSAWTPRWDVSLTPHPVTLCSPWNKTDMTNSLLCEHKGTLGNSIKEKKKKEKPQQKRHLNQLPKGDQKVGYKTADTAHILLPATISISPYSKREALSRRAQQLLSQRQLGRSQPLCFIQTRPNRMSEPLRILRFSLETYQTKYLPQPTVPMDWHNIILPPVATNSLQGFFFSRQQQTRHSEDNTTISLSLCALLHDNIWTGHLKFFFV